MRIRLAILCGTALLLAGMSVASIQLRATPRPHEPCPLPPHVSLEILSERYVDHRTYEARVRLSNPTNGPIHYVGFDNLAPVPNTQHWGHEYSHNFCFDDEYPDRKWFSYPRISCGFGRWERTLSAGGSVEFTVSTDPRSLPVRSGVAYTLQPGRRQHELRHVWTDRIGPLDDENSTLDAARK